MKQFTEGIKIDNQNNEFLPIKVAIINNGMDLYGQYYIEDGKTFTEPRN